MNQPGAAEPSTKRHHDVRTSKRRLGGRHSAKAKVLDVIELVEQTAQVARNAGPPAVGSIELPGVDRDP
jgi:hypothetical protein